MLKWLRDMSLKRKLNIIIGLLIGGTIMGIIVGQVTFARVQVGGAADNLSKLASDIRRQIEWFRFNN